MTARNRLAWSALCGAITASGASACGGRTAIDAWATGGAAHSEPWPTGGAAGFVNAGSGGANGVQTSGAASGGTAGASSCSAVSADHGDCEAVLGWGFDGRQCAPVAGCDCEPDCARILPNPVDCALACSVQGGCNREVLAGAGLLKELAPGTYCDDLWVCTGVAPTTDFESIFGVAIACESTDQCSGSACLARRSTYVDAKLWSQICAASLLPVARIECWLFGP
jgi:hypothetical protein